jgi:hypothetical protein
MGAQIFALLSPCVAVLLAASVGLYYASIATTCMQLLFADLADFVKHTRIAEGVALTQQCGVEESVLMMTESTLTSNLSSAGRTNVLQRRHHTMHCGKPMTTR